MIYFPLYPEKCFRPGIRTAATRSVKLFLAVTRHGRGIMKCSKYVLLPALPVSFYSIPFSSIRLTPEQDAGRPSDTPDPPDTCQSFHRLRARARRSLVLSTSKSNYPSSWSSSSSSHLTLNPSGHFMQLV